MSVKSRIQDYEKLADSLFATNPKGIPANHIWTNGIAAAGKNTPFTDRLGIFEKLPTQSWDMVYLPHCTGDVHLGSNNVWFRDDANYMNSRLQYFAGQQNVRAAAEWISKYWSRTIFNKAPHRPQDLLVTGFSAGGFGATGNYPILREILNPLGKSALVADSGVILSSPTNGSVSEYPMGPMATIAYGTWGLFNNKGIFTNVYAGKKGFDSTNPSSVYAALSNTYPEDRFGIVQLSKDRLIPLFDYLRTFPKHITMKKEAIVSSTETMFLQDLNTWRRDIIQPLATNIGYYMPTYRDFPFGDSHCATIVGFVGTGIEELRVESVKTFIENVLDHRNKPAVMRVVETDLESDLHRSARNDFVKSVGEWVIGLLNGLLKT